MVSNREMKSQLGLLMHAEKLHSKSTSSTRQIWREERMQERAPQQLPPPRYLLFFTRKAGARMGWGAIIFITCKCGGGHRKCLLITLVGAGPS